MALVDHRPLTSPGGTARRLWTWSAAAWAAFVGLTLLVAVWPRAPYDTWLQRVLSDNRRHHVNAGISYRLAHLGAAEYIIPAVIVVGVVWALLARRLLPLSTLVGSYFVMSLVVSLTKRGLHRAEPGDLPGDLGRSFPSGHVASATVLWGGIVLVWWLLGRRGGRPALVAIGGLALAMVAVVNAAMLWRSAHWVTDMLGGMLAAAASLGTVAAATLLVEPLLPRWLGGTPAELGSRRPGRPR